MNPTAVVQETSVEAWPLCPVEVVNGTFVAVRNDVRADPGLPPAVFVHGLGGSSLNFTGLAGELRSSVHAHLVDLPGFGHAPPPHDGDYSVTAQARAVQGLILSLRRGPVHLVGNSMGGAVATRLAARRPDLVRSLTLVSPALPDLRVQVSAVPTALVAVPGMARALGRLTRRVGVERRTALSIALCYGDPDAVTGQARADAVAEYRRRLELPYMTDAFTRAARGVVLSYLEQGPRALWREASRVRAPTLLVYGRRDKLVHPRTAARAFATFADPRLLTVPESGHVAMMEHPRVVARAFADLLRDLGHGRTTSTRMG